MAKHAPPADGPLERSPNELKQMLREAGLRATSARAAVLRCLLAADAPMTHAEVCALLDPLGYDRATIYRNLVDLADVGIARRSDLGDHLWRFELARGEHAVDAHPHFVCTDCGEVTCLPEEAIAVQPVRGAPRSLKRAKVEIQVRGVCNDCD